MYGTCGRIDKADFDLINQNQQKSNNMQVLWHVSVSLTQYT